jgi:hypothetical protein
LEKKKGFYEVGFKGETVAKVPIGGSNSEIDLDHKYIVATNSHYGENKDHVIFHILEEYCGNIKNNRKKWKTDIKPYFCTFTGKDNKWKSQAINFHILKRYIHKHNHFYFKDFDFPNYNCDWLDYSIDMTLNFIHKDGLLTQDYSRKQLFGIDIFPQLEREGHIISTFLPQLTMRVVRKRNYLIENSNLVLTIDWLLDFKDLINDSISLIDIFLMQFYTKAQFAPLKSWNFDEAIVGSKFNRRIDDKLKWIRLITGKNLNIENEKKDFTNIRELRNHLNHFDPPSFCASLEEIAEWMNMILSVSTILFKMRKCTESVLSEELMTLMVQPIVKFDPQKAFSERYPQPKAVSGYNTSIWKNPI